MSREINLKHTIAEASKILEEKIRALAIPALSISNYSKKYWEGNLRKLNYILKCNGYILENALLKSGKNINEITLLDNGGGTGTLTLLAKAIGIKTVIYNDIYDVSCVDAKVVAIALGFVADDYVCADSDELVTYFTNTKTDCDIVVSRNVIEHIYDLQEYFKNISKVSNTNLVVCLATTANIKNPLVRIYTQRLQKVAELKGVIGKWEKERDSTSAFVKIREKIIRESFPNLDSSQISTFAAQTRGLQTDDIILFVKEQSNFTKKYLLPTDACNTCDPLTGNRTENLITAKTYQQIIEKQGLQFELKAGFYNTNYNIKALNLLTPIVNYVIKLMPALSMILAPFVLVIGVRKK